MTLIYNGGKNEKQVKYTPAITHRFASMQALSIDKTLGVARDRLAKKSEHLSNRERNPHPMRTVGMACNETP
jgi:hypothetical protein